MATGGSVRKLIVSCLLGCVAIVLFAAGGKALAHHSFSMFDYGASTDLEGTVQEFRYTNPHSFIILRVKGTDGHAPATWTLEGSSPSTLERDLRRFEWDAGTVKVDWALSSPIPWAAPATRQAGTVHIADDLNELSRWATDLATRTVPTRPFLLVGQQSMTDPVRQPAGSETAWAYTHGPNSGIDWRTQLDAHVERIEAQVERFAPGFRERILARHVLDPVGLEARNANLIGGDVGGGSYKFRQVLFRPLPKLTPYSTPVKGFFIGSAATFPGGAVHGVCGDAAARAALR